MAPATGERIVRAERKKNGVFGQNVRRRIAAVVPILVFAILMSPADSVGQEPAQDAPGRPMVLQIRLDNDAITPITARFIERAIARAELEQAACLVIVLDTPGGLVDSTRSIVKSMLRSQVPVVVYVAPAGARAASAGVFITLAAHVAAMAPGTNIGAAHPVQIGGLPGSPPQPQDKDGRAKTPMEDKILNDTVAWARALAELRGRNAEWATRAVKESLSVPASEAVREKAVDLLADNVDDLLKKIDGREISLASGIVRLRTAAASIHTLEMWWGEQVLSAVANPTLAVLLLVFGFYGILFEMYTPGWGVAGTLGIICLVLGFLAMAVLPINYVGLILIVVALALFVAEVFVTSYGALGFDVEQDIKGKMEQRSMPVVWKVEPDSNWEGIRALPRLLKCFAPAAVAAVKS